MTFNHGQCIMDGIVRNLSDGGATVECSQHVVMPLVFDLNITRQERDMRAKIVWRCEERLGVMFIPAATTHAA